MRFGKLVETTMYEINSKITIALILATIAIGSYAFGFFNSIKNTFWGILN